ncbi:MAG: hypothetical protein JSS89_06295 [Bacteroidetes bacterium]|nr:hypothetical protein [Bacteroidota bacterium]
MLKRIASAALLAATVIGLGACSKDSTTNPTTNATYLVTTSGSYWLYDDFSLTGSSTAPDSSKVGTDSMVVLGPATQGGLSCTAYVDYTTDSSGTTADTTYQREEGGKVYTYFPLQIDGLGGLGAVDLGSKWVVIADQNGTTWTSLDTTLKDVPLDYNGTVLTANIGMKMTGQKIGTENVTVYGTSYSALHCLSTFSITITIVGFGEIPITVPIHYWMVANKGVVKMQQPPQTITIAALGQTIPVPGNKRLLTKAVIK